MSTEKKSHFFTTLPGILSGIAALTTATVGLYVALRPPVKSDPLPDPSVRPQQSLTQPTNIEGEGGGNPKTLFFDSLIGSGKLREYVGPEDSTAKYTNDGYLLTNNTTAGSFFVRLNEIGYFQNNIQIEVTVRQIDGPTDKPFGILFSGKDGLFANAHSFFIQADGGYSSWKWENNNCSVLLSIPRSNDVLAGLNNYNNLKLVIHGDTFIYYINGNKVGTYKSTELLHGYFGLYTDFPGMKVVFKDLKISSI